MNCFFIVYEGEVCDPVTMLLHTKTICAMY